jgi:hypothetical protein
MRLVLLHFSFFILTRGFINRGSSLKQSCKVLTRQWRAAGSKAAENSEGADEDTSGPSMRPELSALSPFQKVLCPYN